jgi:integrase
MLTRGSQPAINIFSSKNQPESGSHCYFTNTRTVTKSTSPKYTLQRIDCLHKKADVGLYWFHDLRHTFNTNMKKAGVDQVVIMKLTGHKTFNMFIRYSHLDKEQGVAAMEKLNGFLAKKNDENILGSNPR